MPLRVPPRVSLFWTDVKLIDLNTGEVLQQVYENNKSNYQVSTRVKASRSRLKRERCSYGQFATPIFNVFCCMCI
jgi:hypothetical protein